MYLKTTRSGGMGDALTDCMASAMTTQEGYNPNFAANNNPGNIIYIGPTQNGQTGVTRGAGGFARFSSPASGQAALYNQIQGQISRGQNLTQFFNQYAPPNTVNAAGGVQTSAAYVRTYRPAIFPQGMGYWGLGDAATVQAQIAAAAAQYGVDPNLALAVAKQESGYQQYGSGGGVLTSSAGALGVMQLMPATAAGLNVDPTNQQQNINGGVKLLSQLLNQFNGNVPLALAAYNAGPGAVQQYGGIPPYAQTQNYVASIMANYQPGGYSAASDSSPDSSPSSLNWLQSLSIPDSLTQDASYILPGGLVLSGSDLLLLGGALVLGLVISAML